jgi:membrane protease YdiL (CAAX protease family)
MSSMHVRPIWHAAPVGLSRLTLVFVLLTVMGRAAAMFGPASWRGLMAPVCIAMAALPWIVLSPDGRSQIGICWPERPFWRRTGLVLAACAGAAAAAASFWLGAALYGATPGHWFVSIARTYHEQAGLQAGQDWSLLRLHLTFTLAACLFSPIGEELFFRGYLQRYLERSTSRERAARLQALLFAAVHLCHHGILVGAAGVTVMPLSAVLWMLQMYIVALVLAALRSASGSLLPAIFAHAGFNAAMNAFVFAFLWH